MTTDNADIDLLAATAYATGISPVDYAAEHVIQAHINAHLAVGAVLARGPLPCGECGRDLSADPCDGCARDLSVAGLSCRILGGLLGAGMTLPEVTR